MSPARRFRSCLFSLFLLVFAQVASSWAADVSVDDAPARCDILVELADGGSDSVHPGASPGLDDVPLGDPPVVLNGLVLAAPRLQQALNSRLLPVPASPPPEPLHKPPSA